MRKRLRLVDHARPNPQSDGRQSGSLMFSIMLTLFVIAALLTLYVERQVEHGRLERGEQVGHALSLLGAGFDAYIDANITTLAAARPDVPGVADALRPTADELVRSMKIKGVTSIPPSIPGASFKFRVSYPDSCTALQKLREAKCHPIGLAYVDKPLMRSSKVDYVALARAVRVMQGRGGYSKAENPTHFVFPDSATGNELIPVINPTGKAGVLAWRADALFVAVAGEGAEHLRTDGSNRMNATLHLDGNNTRHDITGVRNVYASKMSAKQLQVSHGEEIRGQSKIGGNSQVIGKGTVEGSLQIGKGLSAPQVTVGSNARIMGQLRVLGSGLWTSNLSAKGNAIIGDSLAVADTMTVDRLSLGSRKEIGQRCSGYERSIAMSSNGELIICSIPSSGESQFYWARLKQREFDFNNPTGYLRDMFSPYF